MRRQPQQALRRTIKHRLAAVLVAALAYAQPPAPVHIHNFAQVDSNFYRGAEPSPAGIEELQRFGIRLIIDLRESGQATLRERDQARQLGLQYINVPLRPFSAPSDREVQRILVLLNSRGDVPVFLHCRRGKDRTGTIVACYRIQHDRWTNARALEEANQYGMSWTERGMRSFIRHFPALASPLPVQP